MALAYCRWWYFLHFLPCSQYHGKEKNNHNLVVGYRACLVLFEKFSPWFSHNAPCFHGDRDDLEKYLWEVLHCIWYQNFGNNRYHDYWSRERDVWLIFSLLLGGVSTYEMDYPWSFWIDFLSFRQPSRLEQCWAVPPFCRILPGHLRWVWMSSSFLWYQWHRWYTYFLQDFLRVYRPPVIGDNDRRDGGDFGVRYCVWGIGVFSYFIV